MIKKILEQRLFDIWGEKVQLEHPENEEFGDFSTNIALKLGNGRGFAEELAARIQSDEMIKSVKVEGLGFLNVTIQFECLGKELQRVLSEGKSYGSGQCLAGKRYMVEYAHPNTHKELHIGHMRTLITGESLSRILAFSGAAVFRANYQGDIGPHVAKSIWGTQKILEERGLDIEHVDMLDLSKKAHLLGEGYVRGNREYEANKDEIDTLNKKIYMRDAEIMPIYELTRKWSLQYYDGFYDRFGTKFDKLFFESEMDVRGAEIVNSNLGSVFEVSEGAKIFNGEPYKLHKRVFVTSAGVPTYEGKELANAYAERQAFEFDKKVHVVANEQASYFQVVFKVLELLDAWFIGKQDHLSMGMVQLIGRKISSRTGEIITVDDLLEDVKELVKQLHSSSVVQVGAENLALLEQVTMAAVKYSVLRTQPTANVAFDLQQSVSLEGNSGPYLQYTYARIHSVIQKSGIDVFRYVSEIKVDCGLSAEDVRLLRYFYRFPEVVDEAASRYSPSLICTFLYELAQYYNAFYNKVSINNAESEELKLFRVAISVATGQILKNGLGLLGIETPERM